VSRLQHLESLRRDFVANVSHELKTPLTVFKGYLELLEDQLANAPPGIGKALAHMGGQCARMEALVRDLLLLARLEATGAKSHASISLNALLEKMQPAFAHQAERKRQQLNWELQDGLRLDGVADELESAFGNLLGNAIKYTQEGGAIQVRAWQDDKGLHVAVSDTGPGIDARHLPHLTERFYRTDESRNSDTGGTGLGLAIVKHVLQRHGAHLTIDSTPGKGSRFTCHFPIVR
jgi:two-component system phosphate regulon sensor histidine kinase PhoR